MAKLAQVQKFTKINPSSTYLLLISPDEIPHLAIIQNGNYFSLTHKKVIVNEAFNPYLTLLKRTKRKLLFVEVKTTRDDLIPVFKQFTKAASNATTCLVPVQQFLLENSKSEFIYELVPELQAADLILGTYHLNLEDDLTELGDFNLNEYSKEAIFLTLIRSIQNMLKGNNIYLRTIEPIDADLLLKWENNVENWRVSNTIVPFSKSLIEQYVASAQDLLAMRQIRFMICDNATKQAIGTIDLFDYEPIHQRAGVGILMDKSQRGKGFGLEALKLIDVYALTIVGIRNLHASVMSDNEASIKLFEKAGYRIIGERKNWYNVQGEWVDEILYQKELLSK